MTKSNVTTNPEDVRKGCQGCLVITVLLFIGFTGCSILFAPKEKTAAEKLNEWYKELAGFSCETALKDKLRDPDSYKMDGEFVTTADNGTEKEIIWNFRAKNGFGGYNASSAVCTVSKKDGGTVSASIVGQ